MSKKTIKIDLQGNLLRHFGKDYSALISAIKTTWKNKTTSLADIILQFIKHAEINKKNNQDNAEVKIIATGIYQTPKGTCTTKKCVKKGVITHYTNQWWVIYPKLCAKYSLHQIQTSKWNRNLKKAITLAETIEKRNDSAAPKIDSCQPKILAVEKPEQNCWLIDSAANVHICNNQLLMTEYWE